MAYERTLNADAVYQAAKNARTEGRGPGPLTPPLVSLSGYGAVASLRAASRCLAAGPSVVQPIAAGGRSTSRALRAWIRFAFCVLLPEMGCRAWAWSSDGHPVQQGAHQIVAIFHEWLQRMFGGVGCPAAAAGSTAAQSSGFARCLR